MQPNTTEEAKDYEAATANSDGPSLAAGLLIETVTTSTSRSGKRHWTRLRYAVIISVSIHSHSHKKKTTCLGDEAAAADPPAAAAPPPPGTEPPPAAPPAASSVHVIDIPTDIEWNKVAQAVRDKDLTSLKDLGGVNGVMSLRGSEVPSKSEGNAVAGGPYQQGWNTTKSPVDAKGYLYFLLKACNQYTIMFLLLSSGLTFGIGFMTQGVKNGWHDGVAILITVLLLVVFPSVGNYHRERERVRKNMLQSELEILVKRGSEDTTVPLSQVVVGDIVHLKKGDSVPAYGLFIDHGTLVLDEVLSPKIDREQNPFLFSGSKVIDGHGQMIVTSIGGNTAFSEVLSMATDHKPNEKTLSQALMDKPYAFMDYLACCVSILIAVVVLVRILFFRKHDNYNDRPELKREVSMNVLMHIFETIFLKPRGRVSTLASILTAVVLGLQHGVPFVITISLSKWKEKVIQYQADPQNLSACVTMGRITVVCFETSGELMCQQGEAEEFWMGEKDLCINEMGSETDPVVLEALHQGISATTSPTNDLLISWLKTRCRNVELLDEKFKIVDQRQWSSNEDCRSIVLEKIESDEKIVRLHCNGPASTILEKCSHYNDNRGESHILQKKRRKFKQMIKIMEKKGLRTIAYAYKNIERQELEEDELILLALVGFRRPYQEELKLVMEALKNKGVGIKLVSEDELSTVQARASELGIFTTDSNDCAIEGEAFRRLNSRDRKDKLDLISVMASFLPKDKFLMVEYYKKKGHVVGFLGGFTASDTPTLKKADVGITDIIRSTEIARENADLIIRNVCALSPTFKSGACAYHNIRLFYQLQFTACISGLLVSLVTSMHSGESPLTPIHLIWVNLITCLLGGLMMVMEIELQGAEILTQPPAMRTESLITKVIWRNIAIQVSYQASVLLILHFMRDLVPIMNEGVRSTMIFSTFTLCQVVNLLSAMDLVNREVLKVVVGSYWLLMALGAVLVMQVVVVEFGQGLASCVKLNALQWAICSLLAALSWVFGWTVKLLSAGLTNCSTA